MSTYVNSYCSYVSIVVKKYAIEKRKDFIKYNEPKAPFRGLGVSPL
jgi:hypothetical protein